MFVYKCKMCGGDLSVNDKFTIGKCKYCGSTMTLPKSTDQIRVNLFNRANHFRMNYEFDKASGIYESILNQDNTIAEAYWGLVLCKFGIIYVEDQETHKMIPTCHCTQYTSILSDPDFKAAIENADLEAQGIYTLEANVIDEIQKQILDISSKEQSFDVFICYKEIDQEGNRSKDSVIAQELYYLLIQEGFKVFFSRITLEDKIGSAYEPYIFSALNSSKVMVVVGTKPGHINSPWVRNEWSRYLALIKKGENKTLIPAYQDMDPYELPEEFSYLQAQDMSKLGFMQDLIRGIKKIIFKSKTKESNKETERYFSANATAAGLVERAFLCLEDGDVNKADNLLEQALNSDPRNSKAYMGKLILDLNFRNESELVKASHPLTENKNYQRAVRFADAENRTKLEGYNQNILKRIEIERKEKIYKQAIYYKRSSSSVIGFQDASRRFRSIPGYKDSDSLALECDSLAIQAEKKGKKRRKKIRNISLVVIGLGVICITIFSIWYFIIFPPKEYNSAQELFENKKYAEAAEIFTRLGEYKDSSFLARKSFYLLSEDILSFGKRSQIATNLSLGSDFTQVSNLAKRISFYNQGIISVGDNHIVGLKVDGTVVTFGANSSNRLSVGDWEDIVAVSTSNTHTLGLKYYGYVDAVGDNTYGQIEVDKLHDIVSLLAGDYYTMSLNRDGTVFINIDDKFYTLTASEWKDIIAIASNDFSFAGIKTDGSVVTLLSDSLDHLYISGWEDIVQLTFGKSFIVGLKKDGTVISAGTDDDVRSELSKWKNIVYIAANQSIIVGIKSNGTVKAVGIDVPYWNDIISIAVGPNFVVGIKTDGSIVSYGLSENLEKSLSTLSLLE